MIKFRLCLFFLLLTLCSCRTKSIDEKYAAEIAKKHLSLSGRVLAETVKGGYSGDKIFVVTTDEKKYIVRFIDSKASHEYCDVLLYNTQVASDAGYGPKIYFVDPAQGVVITEYLYGKPIPSRDIAKYILNKAEEGSLLQSDQFYISLAHLLQQIHRGPAFKNSGFDCGDWIDETIKKNRAKFIDFIPVEKLEQIMKELRKAMLHHFTKSTPCHNDFHAGNLMITESGLKAIDYGDSCQCEPLYDVAMVLTSFYTNPVHENLLLTTYFGQQPSAEEKAKLYILKQAVLIWNFLHALEKLDHTALSLYKAAKEYGMTELASEIVAGKLNFAKTEDSVKLLKAKCKQVLDAFESQEFKDAVNVLRSVYEK